MLRTHSSSTSSSRAKQRAGLKTERSLIISLACLAILLLPACASVPPQFFDDTATVLALQKQQREWHGTPYLLGGISKNGIDCSAFTQITFAEKLSLRIPRTTKQQVQIGQKIKKTELRAGDLLFFKLGWGRRHVGIYTHNKEFIHASTSAGVKTSSLQNRYWVKHYWQARRVSPSP